MTKKVKKVGKIGALAILSQIPVVSGFSKFFEDFVQSDWQNRIDLWKESIIQQLSQLDEEMEQKIRETSNFASILATAQRGALEDMEKDKVALYANTVINSIKNENIDDTKKHIFLNMLKDFTLLHIEILRRLKSIEETWEEPANLNRSNYIIRYFRKYFTDIKINDDFNYVLMDLENKRCCTIFGGFSLDDDISTDNLLTRYGKEFLNFITEYDRDNF